MNKLMKSMKIALSLVFIFLLLFGGFFYGLVSADSPSPISLDPTDLTKEYTSSSIKSCDSLGHCELVLYSSPQFAQEDGEWKTLDKVKSLKGQGFEVQYLEKDERWAIEVIDFNLTSITYNLNPSGIKVFPYQTNLAVLTKNYSSLSSFTDKYSGKVDFSLFKQSITETIPFNIYTDALKFGDNSTIISFNNSASYNLGDSFVNEASANTN